MKLIYHLGVPRWRVISCPTMVVILFGIIWCTFTRSSTGGIRNLGKSCRFFPSTLAPPGSNARHWITLHTAAHWRKAHCAATCFTSGSECALVVKSTILNICSRVQCSAEVPLFQCSVRAEWPFCSEGNPVDCCPPNIFHSFHPSLILAITKSIILSIISIVITPRSADDADYVFVAELSPHYQHNQQNFQYHIQLLE